MLNTCEEFTGICSKTFTNGPESFEQLIDSEIIRKGLA
jgi:hypothetical protein